MLGLIFSVLHLLIVALGLSDLLALMLFALPGAAYIAYCNHDDNAVRIRSATSIYLSFTSVTLAAAGLSWIID